MKRISKNGLFWIEDVGSNQSNVGITKAAIIKFGCIHVYIPRVISGVAIKQDQVLASLEGSKALAPLLSPVSGKLTAVNSAVIDTPYEIGPDHVLFKVENPEWKEGFL